jgi:hypothetical protein
MNITGRIKGITYRFFLVESLQEIRIAEFDISNTPPACIIKDDTHTFAVSKWVSPKRTRFVVLAYYDKAKKKGEKITSQQFDNEYILTKIREIKQYHSSALHWNLKELKVNLESITEKVQAAYNKIEKETGVKLHSSNGIAKFKD